MNDKKWIILGLVIGVVILTVPLWINLGQTKPVPDIVISETAKKQGKCILSAEEMRTQHMHILDEWREKVVREGVRTTTLADGRMVEMSLGNTCIKCHDNRDEFCNRCHDYSSVRPYCWDCHVDPTKGFKEIAQ